jgi:hypothetical protein
MFFSEELKNMTHSGLRWKALLLALALSGAGVAAGRPAAGLAEENWQSLFDGKSLGQWKSTEFGGEGKVTVANGQINLEAGANLTGITWSGGALPKTNYEISLEAKKTDGSDFFCGLTFPVSNSFCSLIVGGWGGGIVGLSSIDGHDASENETTQVMNFPATRWYRIRVKVTPTKIEAWLDDKSLADVTITGHSIDIRSEVELSKPLGIATWMTGAAFRDIKLRRLQ